MASFSTSNLPNQNKEKTMNADVNRREFVKIGAAGAAMAALPGILRAQQAQGIAAGKYYRSNETVRVACVGY